MSGYVRIHRTLIGHPAFRNDAEALAFAWLVVRAQWKPTRVRYKERAIELERGQVAISQRDMARALDRDKAWVERLWKRLRAEAMINVASEAGVAVITICKYEQYQANSDTREAVDEAPPEAGARQGQGTEQIREEGKKEEETEANASVSIRQPLSEALSIWNEAAPTCGWRQVRALTGKRATHLRNRLRMHGLDGWRAAVNRARASPYLAGADPPAWFTFNWLILEDNFQKLIEGNYDRRNNSGGPDPTLLALATF